MFFNNNCERESLKMAKIPCAITPLRKASYWDSSFSACSSGKHLFCCSMSKGEDVSMGIWLSAVGPNMIKVNVNPPILRRLFFELGMCFFSMQVIIFLTSLLFPSVLFFFFLGSALVMFSRMLRRSFQLARTRQ